MLENLIETDTSMFYSRIQTNPGLFFINLNLLPITLAFKSIFFNLNYLIYNAYNPDLLSQKKGKSRLNLPFCTKGGYCMKNCGYCK